MITTLLLDLDDTLLGNDMGVFLPAYLQAVSQYFPDGAEREHWLNELLNATRAMAANSDPARRLIDVFADCFTQATGISRGDMRAMFERFYLEAYPALQPLTVRRPVAREAVAWAFAAGLQVVIATNPLFPQTAIRQRLAWAGVDDYAYARLTSLENSHFAKPRPEYYAEILALLGRRPEQALMVGNDWEQDIAPAAAIGLPTFWITNGAQPRPAGQRAVPLGSGSLADFLAWAPAAVSQPADGQSLGAPDGPALPHLLLGSAAALASRLDSLPEAEWTIRSSPGEWSLTEVVCHLRDVEIEVNVPRLRILIEQENPFIAGADTDPWAVERNYQSQSGPRALHDFLTARSQSARYLGAQAPGIWSRRARHAIFGPTTLAEIVGWVLDHDRIHLDQARAARADPPM